MLRRNVLRVLSIGLLLVFALNLLLIFYTKRTVQELILGDRQNKLHFALSELNWTVMDRLSTREANLRHLSKSTALTWRGQCVCLSVPVSMCLGAQNKECGEEKEGELVGLRASS